MRNFNDFEKKAITEIITRDFSNCNILDLIADIALSNEIAINIEFNTKTLNVFHASDNKNPLNNFIETIFLIRYLEKESLIFIHSNYQTPNTGNFLSNKDCLINEKNLKKYLCSNISTTIFEDVNRFKQSYFSPSTELIEYYKNGFKSNEEIQHLENLENAKKSLSKADKGLRYSRISLYISTGAILVSLLLGAISLWASFYLANN